MAKRFDRKSPLGGAGVRGVGAWELLRWRRGDFVEGLGPCSREEGA